MNEYGWNSTLRKPRKPMNKVGPRSRRQTGRKWQAAVREKDNFTCQRCGRSEPYIHTHHVAPRSQRPDLRDDVSNGKCLCNSCHTWVHMHPKEAQALGLLDVSETYEIARDPGRHFNNALLTCKGETLWIAEWARRLGVDRHVLEARRKRGWSDEKIIETRIRQCEKTALTYQGRTMNLTEWSRESGLHLATLRYRVRAGWGADRILETPPTPPKERRRKNVI